MKMMVVGLGACMAKCIGACFLACMSAECFLWSLCLHAAALVGSLPLAIGIANQFAFPSDEPADLEGGRTEEEGGMGKPRADRPPAERDEAAREVGSIGEMI